MKKKNLDILNLKKGYLYNHGYLKDDEIYSPTYFNKNIFCLLKIKTAGRVKLKINDDVHFIKSEKSFTVLIMKGQTFSLISSKNFEFWAFFFEINDFFKFKNSIDRMKLKIVEYYFYSFSSFYKQEGQTYKAINNITQSIMDLASLNLPDYVLDIEHLLWDLLLLIEKEMFYIGYHPIIDNKSTDYKDLEPAIEYIEKNIISENVINLDKLCEITSLSKASFMRKFKKLFIYTPVEFVNIKKMEIAKNLIQTTNDSITDIAFKLGYSNLITFERNFKKIYKVNPSYLRVNLNMKVS